jgi:Mu-like prophage major head subunit gpT
MDDVTICNDLLLEATVDMRKLPTVTILAYTGGIMRVPGWGDIVVDLAGLDASSGVAILSDHDSSRRGVVGHGRAEVRDNRLVVTGSISATGQAAREIVDASKNGFPWQASVGIEVIERHQVRAGDSVDVNGRNIKAPAGGFTFVLKGRLREVSIVGLGCDNGTAVSIAASRNRKEACMETEVQGTEVETRTGGSDVEAAERARVANIASICGTKHTEIQARAIEEGWDETRTELEVLRANRPKAPAAWSRPTVASQSVLEAALLSRMGMTALGEKTLGAMAMEQADRLGATNMIDLCRAALMVDGQPTPSGRMELVKAALSTMSLPTALGNVANKVLLDAYNETPASWRAFCAVRSVTDFKPHTGVRPSFTGQLEQVAPGGELKHGSVAEALVGYQVDTFGKMLSIDRRDVINDDLSVFEDAAASYGRMGMRKVSDLVYDVLLANADSFFSAGNGNYLSGADSALGVDSLASAIAAMRTQRDDEGNDLDLMPATLLVTPELETTARMLLESEFIQRAEDVPTGNSLRRAVNLEVEPRLSNTTKFAAKASTKHWYLFTRPNAVPMIVAFLNGKQTPTVEFFGLQQDVSRLAVSWRVYHDFGSVLADPRAAVRSKGEA